MEKYAAQNNAATNDFVLEIRRALKVNAIDIAKRLEKIQANKKLSPEELGRQLARNKSLKKYINSNFAAIENKILADMNLELPFAWDLGNKKNDAIASKFSTSKKYYNQNQKALDAFVNRKINGFNWSDRVHNLTELNKGLYFDYIQTGITQGKSVNSIARDLDTLNTNPGSVDVYDKDGNLRKFSGQTELLVSGGGYKKPYANFKRLVRTEMKQAFNESDYYRRQQLDFVVGIEVKLSANHFDLMPNGDICDQMAGKYPKNFYFAGWHPNCLCYTTSVLMKRSEFREDATTSVNTVNTVPNAATKYVKENADKWKNAEWYKRNFKES